MDNRYVVYDGMGNQYLVDPNAYPLTRNVTGVLPLVPNQFGKTGNVTGNSTLNQTAAGLVELSRLHNQLLVGDSLVASGTGNSAEAQNPIVSIKRPWLDPPEGSVPFDKQEVAALGAVGASVTVVSITVPDGYDGVINAYSWNCAFGGFNNGSGDLKVQILRNGAAVRNYDNILTERGSIAQPRVISPLRIFSNQVITLVINHVANALLNGNVVGCLQGYFYPSAS